MLQTQPTGLDALVPGIPEKVVVTVVAVLVVSGVWRVADYLHDRSDESTLLPSAWRHLLVSGMGVLVTVGGGLFVVAVWGLTGPLVEEVQSYGLGPQSVVNVVLESPLRRTDRADRDVGVRRGARRRCDTPVAPGGVDGCAH